MKRVSYSVLVVSLFAGCSSTMGAPLDAGSADYLYRTTADSYVGPASDPTNLVADSSFISSPQITDLSSPAVLQDTRTEPGATASVSLSAQAAPQPRLSGFASGITTGSPPLIFPATGPHGPSTGATIQGDLGYFFRVQGPPGTVSIDMKALGQITGAVSGSSLQFQGNIAQGQIGLGLANWDFKQNVLGIGLTERFVNGAVTQMPSSFFSLVGGSGSITADGFDIDTVIQLQTNTTYHVSLQAAALANCTLSNDCLSSVAALIDPFFAIDSSVANSGLYSLEFSPGFGNDLLAETPVPAALPLFATGLGMFGFANCRRKRARRPHCP